MSTGSLSDLASRLEAAEGPSEELDAEIAAYFAKAIVRPYPPSDDFGPKNRWQFWSRDGEHFLGSEGKIKVGPWTASLDAAVALVGEKLPGRDWSVGPDSAGIEGATLYHIAKAATPALALLAALCRALEADQ